MSTRVALRARLRPMTAADIAQIMDIERESFPSMWPQTAYRRELQNKLARYIVLAETADEAPPAPGQGHERLWGAIRKIVAGGDGAPAADGRVLGFIGVWLMVGEAHIVTVAVRDAYRRTGIGERLLIAILDLAMDAGQDEATLEVRASNQSAQRLYLKYAFVRAGVRARYYTDNHEDAVLMTARDITSPAYRTFFAGLRAEHQAHHPDLWPEATA